MAYRPSTSATASMGHIRGYSDFFASGFRAVSTQPRRRQATASLYSTSTSTDSESDDLSYPSTSILPSVFRSRHQRSQRRPVSMMISNTQSPTTHSSLQERKDRRSSFVAFSSKLFDRMPFASGDENIAPSTPTTSSGNPSRGKARSRRFFLRNSSSTNSDAQAEVWISAGGPRTPSVPNGGPDLSGMNPSIDPFASSPESRSFFIDLSSDGSSSDIINRKRESFLSMTTNSNSSPSISLIQSPRRERPISIATMPLPSTTRSRRSSFQCRGPHQEKVEAWLAEEDSVDFLTFTPECSSIMEDGESGDDAAAQIDWRQFHIELLTAVEA